MKTKVPPELETYRVKNLPSPKVMTDYYMNNKGMTGIFRIRAKRFNSELYVFSSQSLGWDHLSISKIPKGRKQKLPSWEEMCYIKDLFFDYEERVIQYHPKRSEYINDNPNVLHLWKIQSKEFPSPPLDLL